MDVFQSVDGERGDGCQVEVLLVLEDGGGDGALWHVAEHGGEYGERHNGQTHDACEDLGSGFLASVGEALVVSATATDGFVSTLVGFLGEVQVADAACQERSVLSESYGTKLGCQKGGCLHGFIASVEDIFKCLSFLGTDRQAVEVLVCCFLHGCLMEINDTKGEGEDGKDAPASYAVHHSRSADAEFVVLKKILFTVDALVFGVGEVDGLLFLWFAHDCCLD